MNAAPETLQGKRILVVGLGRTGASAVRYLQARGAQLRVVDSRAEPPALQEIRAQFADLDIRSGGLDPAALDGMDALLVSPGVDLREPLIAAARERGLEIIGDIEYFARAVDAPVVAITGSNGKSTVTALVGEMARAAGRRAAVGGNFGTPALDLLGEGADLYVLELSSFQLELTESLAPAAAVVVNVSPDHIDRHGSLEHYAALKARIYRRAAVAVVNADDPRVVEMPGPDSRVVAFSARAPAAAQDYGLREANGVVALCRGSERLIGAKALRLRGRHNQTNALAALALGEAVGLPMRIMLDALAAFPGLPHRCEWVARIAGVDWINDSKGTNVGAMLASIEGLPGPIVLLAGGQAKGGDFSAVGPTLEDKGRAALLFGADAESIQATLAPFVKAQTVDNLDQAVAKAAELACSGDTVLLSPGCASFDQFEDYQDRGRRFVAAVRELQACSPA